MADVDDVGDHAHADVDGVSLLRVHRRRRLFQESIPAALVAVGVRPPPAHAHGALLDEHRGPVREHVLDLHKRTARRFRARAHATERQNSRGRTLTMKSVSVAFELTTRSTVTLPRMEVGMRIGADV